MKSRKFFVVSSLGESNLYKPGDRVKVTQNCTEVNCRGLTGTIEGLLDTDVSCTGGRLRVYCDNKEVHTSWGTPHVYILPEHLELLESANPGYHLRDIPKGELGSFSKIREELLELEDAEAQGSKIMQAVECSDLLGALRAYAEQQLGLTLEDLDRFSIITERAFKNGHR